MTEGRSLPNTRANLEGLPQPFARNSPVVSEARFRPWVAAVRICGSRRRGQQPNNRATGPIGKGRTMKWNKRLLSPQAIAAGLALILHGRAQAQWEAHFSG